MKQLQKLAIKYLIIGIGVQILAFLAVYAQYYIIEIFHISSKSLISFNQTSYVIISYSTNIIVGIFLLFDAIKYTKNKLVISITGFLMPVFGVCFLLIEKYLNQKTYDNE